MWQGSNAYYIKIQVRNHRVPVNTLEFSASGVWYQGIRTDDNFWNAPSNFPFPITFPLQVRVTSITGASVIDTVSALAADNVVLNGGNNVQLPSISVSSTPTKAPTNPPANPPSSPTKPPSSPTNPPSSPTKPPSSPTNPPSSPTKPPSSPTKPPSSPTKPPSTPSTAKCTTSIAGCTVSPTLVQYIVSGVTVNTAQVSCNGASSLTSCTSMGSNKYQCTVSSCSSPVPYVNGSPCSIVLGATSQSCGVPPASGTNSWWVEFTPPGTGWQIGLTSVRCDTRYYSCGSNYGTKVGCQIADSPCANPIPYYNNSPCPFPSSLVGDGIASSSSSGSVSTGGIIGISVTIAILTLLIVVAIVIKRRSMNVVEEVV